MRSTSWEHLTSGTPSNQGTAGSSHRDSTGHVRFVRQRPNRIRQLREAFRRCEQHGMTLQELGLSRHRHKYREASAYLNDIILSGDGLSDEEKLRELRKGLKRIYFDSARNVARQRARRLHEGGRASDNRPHRGNAESGGKNCSSCSSTHTTLQV